MSKRYKATSPAEPLKSAENALFPGRLVINQPTDRAIGAGGNSANPTGLSHSDQCLQGFLAIMPVSGGEVQIVNNFSIKYAERC
jgi:hypothetical protein